MTANTPTKPRRPEDTVSVLHLQLGGIRGSTSGQFIEVRHRIGSRWTQRFFACEDSSAIVEYVLSVCEQGDTYIGAAPRVREGGKLEDICRVEQLWADIDTAEARKALRKFSPWPDLVIDSGTPGHCHAYWSLRDTLTPEAAKRANRRLAFALGADMAATDAARVVRAAGTYNHKHTPAKPVDAVYVCVNPHPPSANDVVGALADPPEPAPISRPTAAVIDADDPLRCIPASEYIPALTGRDIGRDGKVQCPFHGGGEERTPSLHVYPDDRGWTCFGGCDPTPGRDHAGGDIYAFGARLYGIPDYGSSFPELKRRLAAELLRGWEAPA